MSRSKRKFKNLTWLWVAIGALLVVVLVFRLRPAQEIKVFGTDPVMGEADAPITIVIFGNPTCKYTAQFFADIYPNLYAGYILQGNAKLVYKEFPRQPEAVAASEASMCASDQGKFWEYNRLVLANKDQWISNSTFLGQYAEDLGLDKDKFDACVARRSYREVVNDNVYYGHSLQVSDTPTIFINGLRLDGTPEWSVFEQKLGLFG